MTRTNYQNIISLHPDNKGGGLEDAKMDGILD